MGQLTGQRKLAIWTLSSSLTSSLAASQRAATLSESNPITLTIALGAASAAACTAITVTLTKDCSRFHSQGWSPLKVLERIKSYYLKHESMSFTVRIETKLFRPVLKIINQFAHEVMTHILQNQVTSPSSNILLWWPFLHKTIKQWSFRECGHLSLIHYKMSKNGFPNLCVQTCMASPLIFTSFSPSSKLQITSYYTS
jgi:hypothetical protein